MEDFSDCDFLKEKIQDGSTIMTFTTLALRGMHVGTPHGFGGNSAFSASAVRDFIDKYFGGSIVAEVISQNVDGGISTHRVINLIVHPTKPKLTEDDEKHVPRFDFDTDMDHLIDTFRSILSDARGSVGDVCVVPPDVDDGQVRMTFLWKD